MQLERGKLHLSKNCLYSFAFVFFPCLLFISLQRMCHQKETNYCPGEKVIGRLEVLKKK